MKSFGFLVLAFALLAAGCSRGGGSAASPPPEETAAATTAPTSSAEASASPGESASSETSASPGGTATPAPTPTPDPNLLSWRNGTIVRTYALHLSEDPSDLTDGVSLESPEPGPVSIVWELPGNATIAQFTIGAKGSGEGPPRSYTIAVSTQGADAGYRDLSTVNAPKDSVPVTVPANVQARWVRLTVRTPDRGLFSSISATGTLADRPAGAPIAAGFIEADHAYRDQSGTYAGGAMVNDPYQARSIVMPGSLTLARCTDDSYRGARNGTLTGRRWEWRFSDGASGVGIVNDEGTLIVGRDGNDPLYFTASNGPLPSGCSAKTVGSGPQKVLVLDTRDRYAPYPFDDDQPNLPQYTFVREGAGLAQASDLNGAQAVWFNGVCKPDEHLSAAQEAMLLAFVNAGHKMLITDSDMCAEKTDYSFLPYQFKTANPGANGAHGKRLIEVESDALGSLDKNDTAHYFDAQSYAGNESNQLGDANTTITKDPHWCGHLFGTNMLNVNGFMQMYAVYGQGVIVYDGFDKDDSSLDPYRRVRALELALPVPGSLPCAAPANLSFILQPDRDAQITGGTAVTLPFAMELLANQGWKGHVTFTATGDFPATVTPSDADVAGGTEPLRIVVSVPRNVKAGVYVVKVVATSGETTSQANITLTATEPIKKQLAPHKRIRVYGIHFDVDSAHIQPRSEPVIKEIADLMHANPTVRFQVEGHTDSDGGAAYNLKLSQRRAQAVVDDLVKRYGIARSRLVPKGFGLTRPVASNATPQGKALNRRVELLVL